MKYLNVLISIVCGLGLSFLPCLGTASAWAKTGTPATATDPLSNINRLPAALEQTVGALRTNLESNGFDVARGYWTLWGAEDCRYPIQTVGYCYGNNPTAPYVMAILPTWQEEYVDQRFHHLVNEPLRNMSAIHRLDPREALVIVAQLPPEAKYFGLGSNIFTREAELNTQDPIFSNPNFPLDALMQNLLFGASPDPTRRMMVASIGNSINNVVIQEQSQKSPWDRPAYIIITSDAGMESEVKDALIAAGAQANDIFTEPVAPDLVKVGLDRSADDMITYIRYAVPSNPTDGEKWRKELPLTILRVRDMSPRTYNQPLPIPAYYARQSNFDEKQLAPDFLNLQDAVRSAWTQTGVPSRSFISMYKALDLVGQHCLGYGYPDPNVIRGPMDCLGDSQDSDYQFGPSGQIDNGEVVAIMGVLSTATNNATYTSLSVNWFPQLVGVANIDDSQLAGSAANFADVLGEKANQFYLYYVARDCSGLSHCLQLSTKAIPAGATLKFIQRNYITPETKVGPNPDMIMPPVMIIFDGRYRPAT